MVSCCSGHLRIATEGPAGFPPCPPPPGPVPAHLWLMEGQHVLELTLPHPAQVPPWLRPRQGGQQAPDRVHQEAVGRLGQAPTGTHAMERGGEGEAWGLCVSMRVSAFVYVCVVYLRVCACACMWCVCGVCGFSV